MSSQYIRWAECSSRKVVGVVFRISSGALITTVPGATHPTHYRFPPEHCVSLPLSGEKDRAARRPRERQRETQKIDKDGQKVHCGPLELSMFPLLSSRKRSSAHPTSPSPLAINSYPTLRGRLQPSDSPTNHSLGIGTLALRTLPAHSGIDAVHRF